jgi:adenylate cyclase
MVRGRPARGTYHEVAARDVGQRTILVSPGTIDRPIADPDAGRHSVDARKGVPSVPMSEDARPDDPGVANANSEIWRQVLTGEDPHLPQLRRIWHLLPSSPRCKLCAAPFGGIGRVATRVLMHGPSNVSPLLCSLCFGQIRKVPGGAEIGIGVLFADIRGSTGIAERAGAAEFSRLVQHFYHRAAKAIEDHDGIVDKFLGDGIMALFIPVITGEAFARRAIEAGEAVLEAVMDPGLAAGGVRIGVGVHSGPAFVGALGSEDRLDFTALGDTVNVAARLGGAAGAGELLISDAAWRAAGREDATQRRAEAISGREEPLDVVVVTSGAAVAVA